MPTTALPGLNAPSVFGPRNIALFAFATAAISIASHTGTRSGTSTASLIPASIAEIAASFTPAAGTNTTEPSILPTEFTASCGVLNAGPPLAARDSLHEHALFLVNQNRHLMWYAVAAKVSMKAFAGYVERDIL